ncbi:MAG: hypothetical protein EPO65_01625 [Dehalococcoidia bacterium]|nr:MAG: hypothetical protein EPO65_01625 [Dehalococcoidia bacterium]
MAGNNFDSLSRSFGHALRRVLMRAALAAGAGFTVAVAIGVTAFVFGVRPPEAIGGATSAAASMIPSPPAELRSFFVRTERAEPVPTVIPANTQPFEATRAEAASTDVARVAAPPLRAGDRIGATVSFYYCEAGTNPRAYGDGGGFCGHMRDGSIVRPGAAACDVAYLGQRFRIEGDPDQREYVCNDTGNLVHGLHRDIWFNVADDGADWILKVGRVAVIQVLP